MNVINWTVSIQEADYILKLLADQPFKTVNILLGKLNTQAQEQINQLQRGAVDGRDNSNTQSS